MRNSSIKREKNGTFSLIQLNKNNFEDAKGFNNPVKLPIKKTFARHYKLQQTLIDNESD